MEDQDRWHRGCSGQPAIYAANDRGRTANADLEIVRSVGDAGIARLMRRDQDSDRTLVRAACSGRDLAGRRGAARRPLLMRGAR